NTTKISWINIATGNDIENLYSSIMGFHDAIVINMNCYDDSCDMFIDTTWGSYVQLKFKGVKANNIEIQDLFFSASYEIKDDGFKLIFDCDSDKEYSFIEAEGIEYKLYIKKAKDLDEINLKKLLESNSFINIQPYDNDVVGTIFMYDTNLSIELFYDDYILCISKGSKTPKENYFKRKYSHIISMFNEYGYKLSEYPEFDNSKYGPDFVNVIYQENINKINTFLNYFKICLIPIMINIVFWMRIKLLSQMNWLGFYIFGLGLSFILTILYVIIGLKNYWKKSSIIIYDNGIKCTGIFELCLEYEYITHIENKRRIVIKTNYSTYKLPKTKNKEYIYNLITEKINNK
ncbi:MAG: hypothetical protein J6R47_06415, partial [Acholeplasmatales bacterium]|nr:hypothetical protein [Acholeplasmatales bacterium]